MNGVETVALFVALLLLAALFQFIIHAVMSQ